MQSVIAATLSYMIKFVVGYLVLLISWFELHRYAYLMWKTVLGPPAAG